ncbi:MAG: prepilin peptidase, partial [Limisphaerales bacterium]
SFLCLAIGASLIYAILRAGKLLFGKQKLALATNSKVLFTETFIQLPSQQVAYEELFYRDSDVIILQAKTAEAIDRCYANVEVRLTPKSLTIGEDQFDPEKIPHLEMWTDEITVPREAMGFGDVKFMAAIGAFLGWPAVLFSLMLSSIMGATVGIILIALKKQEWSSRLPYGPYIALAAVIWIFGGHELMAWWWK